MITAEVVITGCCCGCIDGLCSGFVRAKGTIESALDQTFRAQARGIPGTQFRAALRAVWHSTQATVPILFQNLSGDESQEYFSDGLTEEMITQLSRLNSERLGVIARTSAMRFKSAAKTIRQIGAELGVSHVLEGSVRRAAGRVRISA